MDNYEKLRQILDAHPSGAPNSKAFDEILRILFTPDEVAIAIHMRYAPKSVEAIAEAAGLSPEETAQKLETMADKVVITSREKEGKKQYSLVPTIPGLFEFPFMQGGGTPMHEKLGKLWEEYHAESLGAGFAGNPTPLMRVIPIEDAIEGGTKIHPYEEASKLVDQQSYLAVTECACRVSVKGCDRPKDVCLVFGSPAKFLVEKNHAREITKDEAHNILERAEEAGLVHTSNNSADKANLICNCCPCCCTVLRGKTQLNHPHAFLTSSYYAEIKADECSGCELCIDERCPVEAIEMVDDVARVITENCIGCGLCASACPTEAITLIKRSEEPEIPATVKDMAVQILMEKGKLEDFMKYMKS
jgi:electron transport complex protein RnfB